MPHLSRCHRLAWPVYAPHSSRTNALTGLLNGGAVQPPRPEPKKESRRVFDQFSPDLKMERCQLSGLCHQIFPPARSSAETTSDEGYETHVVTSYARGTSPQLCSLFHRSPQTFDGQHLKMVRLQRERHLTITSNLMETSSIAFNSTCERSSLVNLIARLEGSLLSISVICLRIPQYVHHRWRLCHVRKVPPRFRTCSQKVEIAMTVSEGQESLIYSLRCPWFRRQLAGTSFLGSERSGYLNCKPGPIQDLNKLNKRDAKGD